MVLGITQHNKIFFFKFKYIKAQFANILIMFLNMYNKIFRMQIGCLEVHGLCKLQRHSGRLMLKMCHEMSHAHVRPCTIRSMGWHAGLAWLDMVL